MASSISQPISRPTSPSALPPGFEDLEPFVEQWAATSTRERDRRRSDSRPEDRTTFFHAAKDLIDPALTLLDQKPFESLSEQEERLMDLVLGFAHVAMAVEIHGDNEQRHARLRNQMSITRSPADE